MQLIETVIPTQPQAPPSRRHSHDLPGGTAQPSVTRGFGNVMDQERDLQESTEAYLHVDESVLATSLRDLLRDQSARLSGNIALLRQRYEALPSPKRFQRLRGRLTDGDPKNFELHPDRLQPLILKHQDLLADIATLIVRRTDGQRGELILAEVARSHEEMARTLTAFAWPDTTVRDSLPVLAIANSGTISPSEWRRESDGDAQRRKLSDSPAGPKEGDR